MKNFIKKLFITINILCLIATISIINTNADITTGDGQTNISSAIGNVHDDPKVFEQIKNSIVSINTRIAISAYDSAGAWMGTGFIADKEKGIIITNNHVVSTGGIGNYIITFNNGRQAEAKLTYYDSWQDYAFLMVDPKEMPSNVTQVNFSAKKPQLNQKVFIIGNTEGKEFSFHDGYISSLYEITGQMPQASYIINLNSTGGSSGSPLLDSTTNEALGIIYGGGDTYSLALNGEYVKTALEYIKQDKIPPRHHIGVLTQLYSLDKAVKHRGFPKKIMEEYVNKYPDTRNKVVEVERLLAGSPAEKLLKPGDILWEINGKEIAGDLAVLDMLMDKSTKNITLTIYRDGEKITKEIPLYDVNSNKVEQMLEFAGALIFESDDLFTAKTGIPLKSLSIKNVHSGSSFSSLPASFSANYKNHYRLVLNSINNKQLSNIGELKKNLLDFTKQKYLNVRVKNYQPYYPSFSYTDRMFISSQDELIADFNLDSTDSTPRLLKFNQQKKEWEVENIK